MTSSPARLDWQLARDRAAQRALRPTRREAATYGASVGLLASLGIWFPVLPLGPTQPAPAVGVTLAIGMVLSCILSGVIVASLGAALIRALRRRVVAIRYRDPVA